MPLAGEVSPIFGRTAGAVARVSASLRAAARAPERFCLALLVALPFMVYPVEVGGFSLFLGVPLFGLAALALTVRHRSSLDRLRGLLPVGAFAVLAVAAVLAAALSTDLDTAFSRVLYLLLFGWVAGALALAIVAGALRPESVARAIVWGGALAAVAVCLQFGAQFLSSRQDVIDWMQGVYPLFGSHRAAEINLSSSNWVLFGYGPRLLRGVFPFMSPASAGQYLMLALLAAVWLRLERGGAWARRRSALELALLAAIAAGLLFTFSRQAWLGALVGLAILTLPRVRRLWIPAVAVAAMAGLALLVPMPGGGRSLGGYALSAADASTESGGTRLELWNEALDLIPDHALVGVGPGLYGTLNPDPEAHPVYYAHDIFLDAAVELGVAGALALLAVFALAIRSALRRAATLACSMLVAYVVASLFDDVFYFPRDGLLLAVAFSLIASGEAEPHAPPSNEGPRV
jgi:O-antigen ligase